ncbi:MAG: hypothetical protein Q9191_001346 [Dirinaria sp. TL-2023a]
MVDDTLLRKHGSWLQKTHAILDEMVSRGNLVARLRKAELEKLEETLTRLHTTGTTSIITHSSVMQTFDQDPASEESVRDVGSSHSQMQYEPLHDWNSEEGLSGDQLIAVADSLDFASLDWMSAAPLGQLDGYPDWRRPTQPGHHPQKASRPCRCWGLISHLSSSISLEQSLGGILKHDSQRLDAKEARGPAFPKRDPLRDIAQSVKYSRYSKD